jgi:hypothetical protein
MIIAAIMSNPNVSRTLLAKCRVKQVSEVYVED